MKLIELLEMLTEYTEVGVWCGCKMVGRYDGKDSIPEQYNTYEVEIVDVCDDALLVNLFEE